jgi:hypothetical protein
MIKAVLVDCKNGLFKEKEQKTCKGKDNRIVCHSIITEKCKLKLPPKAAHIS